MDDPPSAFARVFAVVFVVLVIGVPVVTATVRRTWNDVSWIYLSCFPIAGAMALGVAFSRRHLDRVSVRLGRDALEWDEYYTIQKFDSSTSVLWSDIASIHVSTDISCLMTIQKSDGTSVSGYLFPLAYKQDLERALKAFAPCVRVTY